MELNECIDHMRNVLDGHCHSDLIEPKIIDHMFFYYGIQSIDDMNALKIYIYDIIEEMWYTESIIIEWLPDEYIDQFGKILLSSKLNSIKNCKRKTRLNIRDAYENFHRSLGLPKR